MIFNSNYMNLNIKYGTPYLSYKRLDEISCIKHGFSTRLGGVSKNEFFSMNLSAGKMVLSVWVCDVRRWSIL